MEIVEKIEEAVAIEKNNFYNHSHKCEKNQPARGNQGQCKRKFFLSNKD